MTRRHPRENDKALAAFIAAKTEIDLLLDRLRDLSADHFLASPDEVHWGHVGALRDYAILLRQITDRAASTGEHCPTDRDPKHDV